MEVLFLEFVAFSHRILKLVHNPEAVYAPASAACVGDEDPG